jgi:hypothetical protein
MAASPFEGLRNEITALQYEICTLPGYYAACSGNSLPSFREDLTLEYGTDRLLDFSTLKYVTDRLSRNGGKELPLYAV